MQDIANAINKAKRRKTGRTAKAELLQMSGHAYEIGTAANRIFANVRIQLDRWSYKSLAKIARLTGVSLSQAAREALEIGEALQDGDTAVTAQRLNRILRRGRRKALRLRDRRQRNETAAEAWAKEGHETKGKRGINLRLTARNLAAIDENRENRKLEGPDQNKTFSQSFRTLTRATLHGLAATLERIASKWAEEYRGATEAKPRKPRQRTYTETKRDLLGIKPRQKKRKEDI